jgi:hypothetical protein
MNDPYADVDWDSVDRLHSVNHMHTFSGNPGGDQWLVGPDHQDGDETFRSMYEAGIRHFALSNYYPSRPTYPLSEYFEDVPDDALGCPNAETSVDGERGHYCSVGSEYDAGDGHDGSWRELFGNILDELAYDDGGGIVINHPKRTGLSVEAILERFDADRRVLGVEAYNHRCEHKYGGTGDARSIWDELLMTGRAVFGFFNPDYHGPWRPAPSWTDETRGRNVLLVPEATEEAAARAYRNGHCYGARRGSGLAFERIDAGPEAIEVELDRPGVVDFVSDRAVVKTERGPSGTYELNGKETYVRVEASDGDGERIFSQPVSFPDRALGGEERHT